jgi:DNA invertase Pin-like site-specific DNA recombinase
MDREREHISALAGVRRAAIRQLAIDQGMPLAEIGKQLGISRQQVWRLLRHGSAAEQWDQECQEFGCHDTGLDSYPQGGVER